MKWLKLLQYSWKLQLDTARNYYFLYYALPTKYLGIFVHLEFWFAGSKEL